MSRIFIFSISRFFVRFCLSLCKAVSTLFFCRKSECLFETATGLKEKHRRPTNSCSDKNERGSLWVRLTSFLLREAQVAYKPSWWPFGSDHHVVSLLAVIELVITPCSDKKESRRFEAYFGSRGNPAFKWPSWLDYYKLENTSIVISHIVKNSKKRFLIFHFTTFKSLITF